jgi:hypothetical protein
LLDQIDPEALARENSFNQITVREVIGMLKKPV